MAYYHPPRTRKNSMGTAVVFLLLVIAGGSYVAATMESGPSAARVYLAEELVAQGAGGR